MKILYVEPYYAGSHRQWIDSYKDYSKHEIDILSLPGKKWKWRMHGGAITLANKFLESNKKYDLILVSDFLNLPIFKSMCCEKINNTPIAVYFHENQITYPWSPKDSDVQLNRDLHYAYINYTTSLISDYNFFNSHYHFNSYIIGLKKYLKKMPDFNNSQTIDVIKNKSGVLYLGCDLSKMNREKKQNDIPVILWNHRWEYDKNPELFFNTLINIKNKGINFKLVILGQSYNEYPKIFDLALKKLKNEILHYGFCSTFQEYLYWVNKSDILPITSMQDFFGVSIVEGICMGLIPILPNRLTYPELIDINKNKEVFYNTDRQFLELLIRSIINYKDLRKSTNKYKELIYRFDWSNMKNEYDRQFEKFFNS